MATFIKGEEVTTTTSGDLVAVDVSYELYEKTSEGVYNSLATSGEINFDLDALNLSAGKYTLTVKAKADGYEDSEYSPEVVYTVEAGEIPDGEWLSVLLTGDADAHTKFMNGNLTGASPLGVGYDIIYATSQIQALLEGKKVYKIAANGLEENTITLYSNPCVGDTVTNVPDGRTTVGTITSTSAQAAGTIVEYPVSNPSAIKENETLSMSWTNRASGIKSVEGYTTPVYYLNEGTFKTKLSSFCSFDFYVGE